MDKSKLLWYSEAEGCDGKLFNGEMTMEEFLSEISEKRENDIIQSKSYSTPLKCHVTSNAIDVKEHIVHSAVFSNGFRIRVDRPILGKISFTIDGGLDEENLKQISKSYKSLVDKERK